MEAIPATAECSVLQRVTRLKAQFYVCPFLAAILDFFPFLGQECSESEHAPVRSVHLHNVLDGDSVVPKDTAPEFWCLIENSGLSPHAPRAPSVMGLPQGCSHILL